MPAAQPTKTVLLVEDDAAARDGMAVILRQHGYVALTAPNGQAALDLLGEALAPPDLVLLDMLMPVMDGWHFLQRFQAGRYRSVPVVIITGAILGPEWAAAHGCAGLLRKPIDEHGLLAEVQRCLGRP
jgi:CheY-like chemotaxis protein